MTFWRNHIIELRIARSLGVVGLTRVSIGPPIRVIDRGWRGSLSAAISAAAAITGTDGWQTAMTWTSGPR